MADEITTAAALVGARPAGPMVVADLVGALAARTHPERAAGWDAVGLQVGDPSAPVRTVGVAHELTESVVHRLEADPVDVVVCYHPLLFRPASRLVPGRSPAGRATRLLRAGVAVVVSHSDFDAMAGGMSDAMASAIGLADVTGFAPVGAEEQVKVVTFAPAEVVDAIVAAMSAAGAGRIGDYTGCAFVVDGRGRFVAAAGTSPAVGRAGEANEEPEARIEVVAPRARADRVVEALIAAHPYVEPAFDVVATSSNLLLGGRIGRFAGTWDDLVQRCRDAFGTDGLRLGPVPGVVPERVAVSPGAGEARVDAAAEAGCDVLVSGDVSHHRVVAANDRGVSIVDPGHAATERPGMTRLRQLVAEVSGLDVVALS